jgi:hypothetical protein
MTPPVVIVVSPAAQPPTKSVGIEVIQLPGETWGMVSTHQPGSHPILSSRQVGHTRVDVIPLELAEAATCQRRLIVGIKLAEIMIGSRCTVRSLDRPAPHRFDVPRIRVTPRPGSWGRVRQWS